jgi:hypothetical protein
VKCIISIMKFGTLMKEVSDEMFYRSLKDDVYYL